MKDDHYEQIAEKLGEYDLNFSNKSADEAAIILSKKITEAMDEIAPILTKTVTIKKINQWSTKGINTSTKTAYRMYKKVKKPDNGLDELKKYKKILKSVTRKAKNIYYEKK